MESQNVKKMLLNGVELIAPVEDLRRLFIFEYIIRAISDENSFDWVSLKIVRVYGEEQIRIVGLTEREYNRGTCPRKNKPFYAQRHRRNADFFNLIMGIVESNAWLFTPRFMSPGDPLLFYFTGRFREPIKSKYHDEKILSNA